jgi:phosphatidylinositol glycan class B
LVATFNRFLGTSAGAADRLASTRPAPILMAIILLGAILRFSFWHPFAAEYWDEVYQYVERAHQLVYGYGIVTWEQLFGVRNWIIPQFLAGVMALAGPFSADPKFPILAARASVVLLSLCLIPGAYLTGRMHSQLAAQLAALAVAIWPQVVEHSVLVLSELFSAIAAICGAAIALRCRESRGWLAAAGFLLMLAIVVRFQSAIFVGVFVLTFARIDLHIWKRFAIGGSAALALGAVSDLAMGMAPYAWIWKNVVVNLFEGKASTFGEEGPLYYLQTMARHSNGLWPLLAVFAAFCKKEQRPLLLAAIAELIAMSLVPHKEPRFVLLSLIAVVALAPVGVMNLFDWWRTKLPRDLPADGLLPLIPALFCILAMYASTAQILNHDRGLASKLVYRAGQMPDTCGIAVVTRWSVAAAYSFARRPVPLYVTDTTWEWDTSDRSIPAQVRGAANAVVAGPDWRGLDNYRRQQCLHVGLQEPACLYTRPGKCDPSAARAYNVQEVFKREH